MLIILSCLKRKKNLYVTYFLACFAEYDFTQPLPNDECHIKGKF